MSTNTSISKDYAIPKHLLYIKYAPLSSEFMESSLKEERFSADVLMQNEVYVGEKIIRRLFENAKESPLDDQGRSVFEYHTALHSIAFATALLHPAVPFDLLEEVYLVFPVAAGQSPKATPKMLLEILKTRAPDTYVAALHEAAPIVESIPYMMRFLEEWRKKEPTPFLKYAPIAEKRCDNYLRKLGWDQETLAVTPLEMKFEVIV